jgi:hypothetical protein
LDVCFAGRGLPRLGGGDVDSESLEDEFEDDDDEEAGAGGGADAITTLIGRSGLDDSDDEDDPRGRDLGAGAS